MLEYPEIVLDNSRLARIGLDEAILCEQKTVAQIEEIVSRSESDSARLFTRLEKGKFEALDPGLRGRLTYNRVARTAVLGQPQQPAGPARIAIVSAGSSDAPVVSEAQATLAYFGQSTSVISDVGVAGIWRLLDRVEEIARHPVVIAVAGMDAALPTVLGGLVPSCLIGVPTSTGYGVAQGGQTAINAMLASCTPGLTVVNIDNGYGAACAAMRVIKAIGQAEP